MNEPSRNHVFISELSSIIPGAILEDIVQTEWHSATFGGDQLSLILAIPGDAAASRMEQFSDMLINHEFTLPRGFVADVAVTNTEEFCHGMRIHIGALIVDD
jgi:hypothetical protein